MATLARTVPWSTMIIAGLDNEGAARYSTTRCCSQRQQPGPHAVDLGSGERIAAVNTMAPSSTAPPPTHRSSIAPVYPMVIGHLAASLQPLPAQPASLQPVLVPPKSVHEPANSVCRAHFSSTSGHKINACSSPPPPPRGAEPPGIEVSIAQ